MKLAFNRQGRYTDFSDGYALYQKRARGGKPVSLKDYVKIVKLYCKYAADQLLNDGIIDLPEQFGSIAAAILTRKAQFRGKKFIGYGKMDWTTGHYDGKLKAFGLVYLPRHDKNANMRSFGFVANRRLFKKMKDIFQGDECDWSPLAFSEDLI